MQLRRTLALFGALYGLLLTPSSSLAQDSEDAARTAEARALFQEGVALAQDGSFEEAAVRFRRAYLLRPAAPIAFNFGNALVESGRLVEGAEMMRQVTRDPDAPRDLKRSAEEILRATEPRIGRLVVHVSGHPDGAVVAVDGSPVDPVAYGVPISADPGSSEVTASRNGETVASTSVDVPEGGRAEVSLEVPEPVVEEPVVVIAPAAPVAHEEDGGTILGEWWFWTIVGVVVLGGVLVGVAAASGGGVEEPIVGTTQPGVLTWD